MKTTRTAAELTVSSLALAIGLFAARTVCYRAALPVKNALLLFLLAACAVILHALVRLANARLPE